MDKPRLKLVGTDGNAFAILGAAQRVARKAGWDSARIDGLLKEAMSGDYTHLLATMQQHFRVY